MTKGHANIVTFPLYRNGRKTLSLIYVSGPVIFHELSYIRLLFIIQVQILVVDFDMGPLKSPEVAKMFLLITHN